MRLHAILLVSAGFLIAADAPKVDRDKLQETILALEKSGWEALKKQDVETMKTLTADDFVGIFSDGNVATKADLVKLLADFKVTSYALDDVKMVLFNKDAAMLTFKVTYESVMGGEKTKNEAIQASSGWVRRDGKWQNIFYQETKTKK